mmetsp:Transcript_2523/g.5783  ORF Transcript_2523/g.5783 Transcript_2523/m.5783 type:complete len:213 (-) Transcript_2523:232-870(-)
MPSVLGEHHHLGGDGKLNVRGGPVLRRCHADGGCCGGSWSCGSGRYSKWKRSWSGGDKSGFGIVNFGSRVEGNSRIRGNGGIRGNSRPRGNSRIRGNGRPRGNGRIRGHCWERRGITGPISWSFPGWTFRRPRRCHFRGDGFINNGSLVRIQCLGGREGRRSNVDANSARVATKILDPIPREDAIVKNGTATGIDEVLIVALRTERELVTRC